MSQEIVDAFKRGLDAYSRRDLDALMEELDPDVSAPTTARARYVRCARPWRASRSRSRTTLA